MGPWCAHRAPKPNAEGGATPVTRAEEVRQQIAADIVAGRLKPGQQLEENVLAAQFNVSRTPVRDALRELGGTGLVEVRPHRGVRVAVIDVSQLEELFEAQAEIEGLCAQLAALRMSAADRRQLEMIQAESDEAIAAADDASYAGLNERLHDLIYGGTRNGILLELARSLRRRGAPFRLPVFYRNHDRMRSSCAEHQSVVMAILASDATGAGAAMRVHIANTSVHVIRYFKEKHDED
jgi:DNA-binding GntR family transcriptional regulator